MNRGSFEVDRSLVSTTECGRLADPPLCVVRLTSTGASRHIEGRLEGRILVASRPIGERLGLGLFCPYSVTRQVGIPMPRCLGWMRCSAASILSPRSGPRGDLPPTGCYGWPSTRSMRGDRPPRIIVAALRLRRRWRLSDSLVAIEDIDHDDKESRPGTPMRRCD